MKSGVYQISFACSEKTYIGSALSLMDRRDVHLSNLRNGKHGNLHLQRAFNKYGEDQFRFNVLLYCDHPNCVLYEQMLIDTISLENLYNILPHAESTFGYKHSEETKRKISESQKGKIVTSETCAKISASKRNPSQETRDKLSAASMGKTRHLGFKHSEETRAKISAKLMGHATWNKGMTGIYSEETRKKISDGNKGKVWSPEMREKMIPIIQNRSQETRNKLSVSITNYWKNKKERGETCRA